jgi:hypothetical protein
LEEDRGDLLEEYKREEYLGREKILILPNQFQERGQARLVGNFLNEDQ